MPNYNVAVVPGDGIGPEVRDAALVGLEAACTGALGLTTRDYRAGATCYLDAGEAFPGPLSMPAVLHGASGLPSVRYPNDTEAGRDFCLNLLSDGRSRCICSGCWSRT